jgi:hypothetical protein
MRVLSRSHRSVEFKHQNISAVLDKLGLPWIPGYRPKENFQNAIFDAIDRYLSHDSSILSACPASEPAIPPVKELLVEPPAMSDDPTSRPPRLRRLIRKFDPVERDARNRRLGRLGEEFVMNVERDALRDIGLAELANKIRWTSKEDGDGAGFDIESFDREGRPKVIEVKTTNGAAHTPFFVSRTEMEVAEERHQEWQLYRVHLFATTPRIFILPAPLASSVRLTTEVWRAGFA